ncbi:MAG: pyridoxal-phosphate dependent enzyme [Ferruginibacter sp.]
MYFDRNNIILQPVRNDALDKKNITLHIARFDLLHPVVSGNKFYKLYYFLEKAVTLPTTHLQTYGGAYSNHLVATAYAAQAAGISCTGIVRGERPASLSAALLDCESYGIELSYISREQYASECLHYEAGDQLLSIPEGGYHPLGAKGAALMYDDAALQEATHICLAAGTATTLAGLLQKAKPEQDMIAVPVLKGFHDMQERLAFLNGKPDYPNLHIWNDYHFGGYAKKDNRLLEFMNHLYETYELPTDMVYTSKLLYAVFDQLNRNYFPPGSRIICLHTGGLQGNRSLPGGTLIF